MTVLRAKKSSDPLQTIPNIGPAIAEDLRRLGIKVPADLAGKDPQKLYEKLGKLDGALPDPCVLDTFCAAVDFASGKPGRPWWEYSRKRLAAQRGRK